METSKTASKLVESEIKVTIKGRGVVAGIGSGPALVTRMPINFTASLSKPPNLLPWKRAEIQDRLHELYKKNIKNTVLVFPACIGSTYTGMLLLQILHDDAKPAAMIVQDADSLLVSGAVLGDVWFNKGVPIVEYKSDDLYDKVQNGAQLEVDGASGVIKIGPATHP